MKTKKNIKIIVTGILLLAVLVMCLSKIYMHEKGQSYEISLLKTEINSLKLKIDLLSADHQFEWKDDAYNYLAIGNSITIHEECDYWWNECGMAASSKDNDYFHQTSVLLKEIASEYPGGVFSHAYNFSQWETMSSDRAECLELLSGYLNADLQLITVQLGENVGDMSTFQSDFKELIVYIKTKAPNAKIIIIGDFWMSGNRDIIKKDIANEMGVLYVSLEEIADKKEYQCGLGSMVYDEEGKEHQVEHEGVAKHPNDLGMHYIAHAIIDSINYEMDE